MYILRSLLTRVGCSTTARQPRAATGAHCNAILAPDRLAPTGPTPPCTPIAQASLPLIASGRCDVCECGCPSTRPRARAQRTRRRPAVRQERTDVAERSTSSQHEQVMQDPICSPYAAYARVSASLHHGRYRLKPYRIASVLRLCIAAVDITASYSAISPSPSATPPGNQTLAMRVPGEQLTLRPRTKPWLLRIWIELEDIPCGLSLKPFAWGPPRNTTQVACVFFTRISSYDSSCGSVLYPSCTLPTLQKSH